MKGRNPIALGIGLVPLAVQLAACEPRPEPAPAYYVEQACTAAGETRGTPEFDKCIQDQREKQLRNIYDMSIRGRAPGL
jgi:hypothetical protein